MRPTGAMSYVVVYRAGAGRGAPVRRFTIASVGKAIRGAVAHGQDPAGEKATERGTLTVAGLADRFMSEHVEQKRKPGTIAFYRHLLDKIIKPELGATKADKVTRAQVARLHGKLRATPFQANRVLAVTGSMYTFAGRSGIVAEGMNPARRIEQFKEHRRERFLTGEELVRLGAAIREAETKGIPWDVDEGKLKARHLAKPDQPLHQDRPFRGSRDPASPVHRLSAPGNPAPGIALPSPVHARRRGPTGMRSRHSVFSAATRRPWRAAIPFSESISDLWLPCPLHDVDGVSSPPSKPPRPGAARSECIVAG